MTLGIAAAVAFCHAHKADAKGRFARYSRDRSDLRSFQLRDLYERPYVLADKSVVVQLCHPGNSEKNSDTRRKKQGGSRYTSDIALLKEGLEMAGLISERRQ